MFNKILSNKIVLLVAFCTLSFLAGAVNGFVGTGGGIIFVFMLSTLTHLDKRDVFATSLLSTAIISTVSLFSYVRQGCVNFDIVISSAAPAILGGTVGAFLVDKINTRWLSAIFSILLIYSGVYLIF